MSQLPRRTFLKGVGLTMGLPLLEAMGTRDVFAARGKSDAPVRMGYIFFPNGAIMDSWKPKGTGKDFELPETLQSLAEFQGDINMITGLAQDMGRAHGNGPGDHARASASYLTGAHPYKTSGADIRLGISVDQLAAERMGRHTKLPSLELGVERGRNAGSCDSGYSCAYSSNISWKTETTPMAKEINPRLVFERLFGSGREANEARAQREFYRKSILDTVTEDAQQLQSKLGTTDRRKIDEYFASVRQLEQRIDRLENQTTVERPELDLPEGVPSDMAEHIRLMFDLMVLAFQTDTTRVTTFMMGNAGSNRTYPMVGVNDGHHYLSHHRNNQEMIAKIRKIDRFLADQFGYFVKQLKSVQEGEGTLLDKNCRIGKNVRITNAGAVENQGEDDPMEDELAAEFEGVEVSA
jgi:hypothetical protein